MIPPARCATPGGRGGSSPASSQALETEAHSVTPEEKYLTHLLYPLYRDRGGKANLETLTSRLWRLDLGISAEEEFAVLLSWLGRCRLVHKLDQSHAPTDDYKIPDLLAIFSRHGRPLPVLIEVKSTNDRKLSWTPRHLGGFARYGKEVGLPVLLAWKQPMTGFWALCELRHFQKSVKNMKLKFLEGMTNSLMCTLAGDFSFTLQPGVTWHLHIRKLGPKETDAVTGTSRFEGVVERSYFATRDGKPFKEPPGFLWLFMGTGEDETTTEEDETFVHEHFVIPNPPSQFAHRVLPLMLQLGRAGEEVPWHELRRQGRLPISGVELARAARRGIEVGAVNQVMTFRPKELPAFLA